MNHLEIEKFLDFLQNQGIYLCQGAPDDPRSAGPEMFMRPITKQKEGIVINSFIHHQS